MNVHLLGKLTNKYKNIGNERAHLSTMADQGTYWAAQQ